MTELRDWAGGIQPPSGIAAGPATAAPPAGAAADAVSALINLGWKRPEAQANSRFFASRPWAAAESRKIS